MFTSKVLKSLSVGVVALAICGNSEAQMSTTTSTTSTNSTTSSTSTDAQAVMIIQTVNEGEVSLARLAEKSKNPEVKQFAEHMVRDHSSSNTALKDYTKKAKLQPAASETSGQLQNDAEAKKKELMQLKGHKFDMQYIDTQVEMHSKVLELLDQNLIPNASSTELKDLLAKTRASVAQHRDHATKIKLGLDKKL